VEWITSAEGWAALLTLAVLEIVLGIDNIIFISILVDKLPKARQEIARRIGLFAAMFMRIGLLMMLAWIVGMVEPLFTLPVLDKPISGRDLILIGGGLFLIWKSTGEIHGSLEGEDEAHAGPGAKAKAAFASIILQIMVIDLVFSLDSIITAVGMVDHLGVMVAAVIAAVGVMLFAAKPIGEFVDRHPSVKVLALAFLVMVGMALTAEAFDAHVPKGYIYAAMSFSLVVEALNIRARAKRIAAQPEEA